MTVVRSLPGGSPDRAQIGIFLCLTDCFFFTRMMCVKDYVFMYALEYMPDSHKFVHYHWIRAYINHARAEIARVGIRYSLFQKQEKKSSASTMRKNPV